MNWLDHEYLVPVLIGNEKDVFRTAGIVKRRTKVCTHIFGERFSFFQKLRYECHVVAPMREEFAFESLVSFSKQLPEYYFPVLIICGDNSNKFADHYSDKLECAFLTVKAEELLHYLEEKSHADR